MTTDKLSAGTLREAQELLHREWPGSNATAAEWIAHHQRGAELYATVAQTDPDRPHEALFWAKWERDAAAAIARHCVDATDTAGGVRAAGPGRTEQGDRW
jgi:hypothetical protein